MFLVKNERITKQLYAKKYSSFFKPATTMEKRKIIFGKVI